MTRALALLFVLAAGPALADGGAAAALQLMNPWIRSVIPARPAAAYFTLKNLGGQDVTLTGASSPGCGAMMLHRTVRANGVEKMLPVDHVAVPAHQALSFAPGGYHVMCMMPAKAVHPGGTVPVSLLFADGSKLTAPFPVKNAMGK